MKINSFNNNYKKINFTALKTDAVFRKVVNNAKHEILDCEYINPKIWTHTLAFVRKMKKLFPEGVLETRPSPYGYIPILKPFAQKQYYKNNLGMKPAEIHLNTILLGENAWHNRDIRELSRELVEVKKRIKNSNFIY